MAARGPWAVGDAMIPFVGFSGMSAAGRPPEKRLLAGRGSLAAARLAPRAGVWGRLR
jgi:hypothetical protein